MDSIILLLSFLLMFLDWLTTEPKPKKKKKKKKKGFGLYRTLSDMWTGSYKHYEKQLEDGGRFFNW